MLDLDYGLIHINIVEIFELDFKLLNEIYF